MKTFKTIVIVATLLGVGYGAHVVLIQPVPNGDLADAWGKFNQGDDADVNNGWGPGPRPDVELPPLEGPPAELPAGVAESTSVPSSPPAPLESAPPGGAGAVVPLPNQSSPTGGEGRVTSHESEIGSPAHTTFQAGPTVTTNPALDATPPQAMPPHAAVAETLPVEPSLTPGEPFDDVWESAQAKLQAGQLVEALFTLSLFYNDEQLSDPDRNRLVPLLDQLAGTVVYSDQHWLHSGYSVAPQDSLASIAATHSVPVEFLARVNGLSPGSPLQAGQQLKVIRGPFRGELSLKHRELTLFVGRYYAGRFVVGIGRDLPAQVQELEVTEISGPRPYVDRRTGNQVAAGDPANPYGGIWIGLHDPALAESYGLGIHSVGGAVDASDTRGCVSVSAEDAVDLRAILSVGSRISVVR